MQYATYIPPGYKSWVSFYEAAKAQIKPGVDILRWQEKIGPDTIILSTISVVQTLEYTYSVRFIEQQTLAELYELRKLQTFNFEECRLLHYALQHSMHSMPSDISPEFQDLKAKVDKLFMEEIRKRRKKGHS